MSRPCPRPSPRGRGGGIDHPPGRARRQPDRPARGHGRRGAGRVDRPAAHGDRAPARPDAGTRRCRNREPKRADDADRAFSSVSKASTAPANPRRPATWPRRCAGWGRDPVLTREPGGAPGAEDIRRLLVEGDPARWSPETEILLFTAARRDHLERTIRPALDAGRTSSPTGSRIPPASTRAPRGAICAGWSTRSMTRPSGWSRT
jgi:hypothetical protein